MRTIVYLATGFVAAAMTFGVAPAQTAPSTPEPSAQIYDPKLTAPTGPMQVEPISPTSFKDVGSGQIYQLYGVASCAVSQRAIYGKVTWPCGLKTMSWLVDATLAKWIVCMPIKDDGKTTIARCATHDYPDVAAAMLKTGLVIVTNNPDQQLIPEYRKLESDAQTAHLGLWSSKFVMPWDYKE